VRAWNADTGVRPYLVGLALVLTWGCDESASPTRDTDGGHSPHGDGDGGANDPADAGADAAGGDGDGGAPLENDAGSDSGSPELPCPTDCDDGIDCTVDECSDGVCLHRLDKSLCAAGESCLIESGGCTAGTACTGPGLLRRLLRQMWERRCLHGWGMFLPCHEHHVRRGEQRDVRRSREGRQSLRRLQPALPRGRRRRARPLPKRSLRRVRCPRGAVLRRESGRRRLQRRQLRRRRHTQRPLRSLRLCDRRALLCPQRLRQHRAPVQRWRRNAGVRGEPSMRGGAAAVRGEGEEGREEGEKRERRERGRERERARARARAWARGGAARRAAVCGGWGLMRARGRDAEREPRRHVAL
jgi:hypothetical protein